MNHRPMLGVLDVVPQSDSSRHSADFEDGRARLMDNPKAINQQPAAATVLAALVDQLHSAEARGHRRGLAVVRAMSSKDLGS